MLAAFKPYASNPVLFERFVEKAGELIESIQDPTLNVKAIVEGAFAAVAPLMLGADYIGQDLSALLEPAMPEEFHLGELKLAVYATTVALGETWEDFIKNDWDPNIARNLRDMRPRAAYLTLIAALYTSIGRRVARTDSPEYRIFAQVGSKLYDEPNLELVWSQSMSVLVEHAKWTLPDSPDPEAAAAQNDEDEI